MKRLRALLLLSTVACCGPVAASDKGQPFAQTYAAEQQTYQHLTASPLPDDKRALGDLLADGLQFSAKNPLREPDHEAATDAYRAAIAAGDRSNETLVSLARLALYSEDRTLIVELGPKLRQAMLRQDGEAAYILAIAVRDGYLASNEAPEALMKSAAVMGSLSALLDLTRSGAAPAQTVRDIAMRRLQAKAMSGSAGSMVALAHVYRDGVLVQADEAMANKWLEAAAAVDHASAAVELATRLVHGIGGPADPARAQALLREAAEKGSSTAAMALGEDALDLGPLKVSHEEGRRWLVRAMEVGEPRAAIQLTSLDLKGALHADVGPEERAKLIDAALGPIAQDADALAALSNRFRVSADGDLLAAQLLPLLEQRTLDGSEVAGIAYDAWLRMEGRTMSTEVSTALVASLRKSAETGVAGSTYTLAALSLDGRIAAETMSREEAVEHLFDAAESEVGQAALRIGKMYAYGRIFAKSDVFAKRWLEKAAALDVEAARWLLADLQSRSEDPRDRAAGERFLNARIETGDTRAAIADVARRLRNGTLDEVSLARAEALAQASEPAVNLARVLTASGRSDRAETARRILRPFVGENPNSEALVIYARTLMDAGSGPQEVSEGVSMLERAVALGSNEAAVSLAGLYLSNMSYDAKQEEAVKLVEGVLDRDPANTAARLLLSDAYLLGYGVTRDPVKANALIAGVLVQSSSDNPEAAILEADWLSFSDSKRDPDRAVTLLKQQVARGSAAAERALGITYLNGFGPSHDADLAAGYLYGAAQAGDKEAMAGLGHLLINGMGVSRSSKEGIAWLTKAGKAGNATAMYDLSRIFALGSTGRVDEAMSVEWLRRAAENGHPAATYQLGTAYLQGTGVAKDRGEALRWLERSKAAGNLLAARTIRQAETADPQADVFPSEGE